MRRRATRSEFLATQLDAIHRSPTWRTVPPGCAYNPDHPPFLLHLTSRLLQAAAASDGRTRIPHGGGAEGCRGGPGRRCRQNQRVSECPQTSARAGVCRAGSGAEESARRARRSTEGRADESVRRGQCCERAYCRGTCGCSPRGGSDGGAALRRNRAPHSSSPASPAPSGPGRSRKRGSMRRNRRVFALSRILFVSFFAVVTARAAEEGSNATAQTANEIFNWINFAIVASVLLWLCLKKAPGFFRRRAEAISSAITKAGSAKAAAEAQLREAENKLANIQKEIAELRAVAERESAAEVARIRAAAQTDAQKIAAAANAEMEGAESLLVQLLTPKAQESLISNFVKSLEGRPN